MPDTDLSAFSKEQLDRVVAAEALRSMRQCTRLENPRGILLAGQPGAGKTVISSMMMRSVLNNDGTLINADEFRRLHPNYHRLHELYGSDAVELTARFSGAVTEGLIAELSDQRINLVIEGTGRTVEVPRRTAILLAEKGYRVELAAIAARPEISLISTVLRFYQMNERGTIPRSTALEAHDRTVDALPANLDTLLTQSELSQITIWDRELHLLYDSVEDTYELPSVALQRYWSRAWSQEEILYAREQIELLRTKEAENQLGQSDLINLIEERVENAVSFQQRPSGPELEMW